MTKVPADFSDRRVCIMGCGYVGLTLAAVMADLDFDVIGIEIRDDLLRLFAKGEPHFHEPGLAERMRRLTGSGTLRFAKHIPVDCNASVYIITVGTPLGANDRARMDMIENTATEVAKNLRGGELVILRSTVKVGTTREIVKPILDAVDVPYDLAFCPERTLEGVAMAELRVLPQIVGAITRRAEVRAAQMFQFITPTVVRVSAIESSEMIKLVDNTQRDVHFAFANEIARLCDATGISAREVIGAGKLGYSRTNLPMPGPVGGPCLEKDSYILAEAVEKYDVVPEMTLAARAINKRQLIDVPCHLRSVTASLPDFPVHPVVTFAGVAFKGRPPTDDLRGTTVRPIIEEIRKQFPGAQLRGYDAVVDSAGIRSLGLDPVSTLEDAFRDSHLFIVHNNHPCFAHMEIERLAGLMARPGIIYDFWNNFDGCDLHMPHGTGYMALGSHGLFRLSNG